MVVGSERAEHGEAAFVQAPMLAGPSSCCRTEVGDERMGEPEPVVARFDDDATTHQVAQRGEQIDVVERRNGSEHLETGGLGEHGESVDDRPLDRGEIRNDPYPDVSSPDCADCLVHPAKDDLGLDHQTKFRCSCGGQIPSHRAHG